MKNLISKMLFATLLLGLFAAPAFAQAPAGSSPQSGGTLVFSLKFTQGKLEVDSVSLVPGEAPDYKTEPPEGWLSVEFMGEGQKVKTIKVPDPRLLDLEVFDNNKITGVQLKQQNATLTFAAPNPPGASTAQIRDENGTTLLTLDYRKGIRLDSPGSQPPQAPEFEPTQTSGLNIPIAALLGAAALAIAFVASRQSTSQKENESEDDKKQEGQDGENQESEGTGQG